MRLRAILPASVLAVAAVLAGAGSASAATLYTTTAQTTPVSVGSAFSATATSTVTFTSATSLMNQCTSSTLSGTVQQNSGGTVAGNITSGSFSSCSPFPYVATFPSAWALVISGSSTIVGGTTSWNATLANFRFDLNNGPYSGNFTTGGVTAIQNHASGPICLRFADAGTYSGPLTGNGRIDANYCLGGGSAAWSLK